MDSKLHALGLGSIEDKETLLRVMKDARFCSLVNKTLNSELTVIRSECERNIQNAYQNFRIEALSCMDKMEARYTETFHFTLTQAVNELQFGEFLADYQQPSTPHRSDPQVLQQGAKLPQHTEEKKYEDYTRRSTANSHDRIEFQSKDHLQVSNWTENARGNSLPMPVDNAAPPIRSRLGVANSKLESTEKNESTELVSEPISAQQQAPSRHQSGRSLKSDISVDSLSASAMNWRKALLKTRQRPKRLTFQEEILSFAVMQKGKEHRANDKFLKSAKHRKEHRKSQLMMGSRRSLLGVNAMKPVGTPKEDEVGPFNDNESAPETPMSVQETALCIKELSLWQQAFVHLDVWLHGLVTHEGTYFRRIWDATIFVSLIYCSFSIPYQLAFIWPDDMGTFALTMRVVNDIVFNLDLIFNFFVAIRDKEGILQWDLSAISKDYASTWLTIDILGSVPFDRIVLNFVQPDAIWPPFLRLLRIVSLLKFDKRFKRVERTARRPFILRLFRSGIAILMGVHWFSCLAFVVSDNTLATDEWIGATDFEAQNPAFKYARLLYWVSISMIGESSSPQNFAQVIFSLVVFWGGLLMYFTLCSNLVTIMTNMNLPTIEFTKTRDRLLTQMRHMKLPPDLRLKVLDHFEERHSITKGVDAQDFMRFLPYHIRQEVSFHLTKSTLDSFSMFDHSSLTFLSAVMLRITASVCMPGDVLCIEGDMGNDMYFVVSGELDVFKKNVGKVGNIGEGSVFGEKLMFAQNARRNATVRAVTICTLYTLSKPMFDEIRAAYPEEAKVFDVANR